ncbi:hypothetical protein [Streptomyces cellostaticus]|uniref:hypothetical protein n=2 Tax=Streptomyces cellostaticus TaxID=67285 RepID=UPI00131C4117|nr:hypothetical protein [Streptomyces cellostaticus]
MGDAQRHPLARGPHVRVVLDGQQLDIGGHRVEACPAGAVVHLEQIPGVVPLHVVPVALEPQPLHHVLVIGQREREVARHVLPLRGFVDRQFLLAVAGEDHMEVAVLGHVETGECGAGGLDLLAPAVPSVEIGGADEPGQGSFGRRPGGVEQPGPLGHPQADGVARRDGRVRKPSEEDLPLQAAGVQPEHPSHVLVDGVERAGLGGLDGPWRVVADRVVGREVVVVAELFEVGVVEDDPVREVGLRDRDHPGRVGRDGQRRVPGPGEALLRTVRPQPERAAFGPAAADQIDVPVPSQPQVQGPHIEAGVVPGYDLLDLA